MIKFNEFLGLNGTNVVLASGSPRRKQLLDLVGLKFDVAVSDFDEDSESFMLPEVQVLELSQKKAEKVAETVRDGIVIGADTVVSLKNEVLGKPKNALHAREMLGRLSGATHTVFTGFSIIARPADYVISDYEKTDVTFRKISDAEIDAYVETGSPLDKAGAYGIQDHGALFVTRIDGCFYNVMGFPLTKFYLSLRSFLNSHDLN